MIKIKKIFIEKGLKTNSLTEEVIARATGAKKSYFTDLKEINREDSSCPAFFSKDTIIIARQKGSFLTDCPCSPGQVPCGYHIIDWGMGCPYKCGYCYLNYYQNIRGILIYSNLEDCFNEIDRIPCKKSGTIRIGTGEFMDSLALEPLAPVSKMFVESFASRTGLILELKTKSANVSNLLKLKHNKKTVVSWTVNTGRILKNDEHGTPCISDRITAACKVQKKGYLIGLHFDPIVYYQGWEKEYKNLVEYIFSKVDSSLVAWASLGTFRYNIKLRSILDEHYKDTCLLEGEFITGDDGKIRYFRPIRRKIYNTMIDYLSDYLQTEKIYLCMESAQMWEDVREYTQKEHGQRLWSP